MATLLSINQIDPTTFQTENYNPSDESLLSINITSTVFNPETDYIEFYIYNINNNLLIGSENYVNYSILDNELYVDPNIDVTEAGYDEGIVNVLYNFYTIF